MNLKQLGLEFAVDIVGPNNTKLDSNFGKIVIEQIKIEAVSENGTEIRNQPIREQYELEECGERFEEYASENEVSKNLLQELS